jgi:hypothetical protein
MFSFMVLIGLFLVVVAAGFTADVFLENHHHVDMDVLGRTVTVTPGWIVLAGIIALAVFVIGARLLALGVRRARHRKAALRSAESATRERDELVQQLTAEREAREEITRSVAPSQHPVDVTSSSID